LIMIGHYCPLLPKPTYVNKCLDLVEKTPIDFIVESSLVATPRRLAKEVKVERDRMKELLHEDFTNRQIYLIMVKEGLLINGDGKKVLMRCFLPIIGKMRKSERKPKTPNLQSTVMSLIKEGKTYEDIIGTGITLFQLTGAFGRMRMSLAAFKRGRIVKFTDSKIKALKKDIK